MLGQHTDLKFPFDLPESRLSEDLFQNELLIFFHQLTPSTDLEIGIFNENLKSIQNLSKNIVKFIVYFVSLKQISLNRTFNKSLREILKTFGWGVYERDGGDVCKGK